MTGGAARLSPPIAVVVWVLATGGPILLAVSLSVIPADPRDGWAFWAYTAVIATWGIAGALITTRRRANAVGWLLWIIGVAMTASLLGQAWATISLLYHGGSLPGTVAGVWLTWLFLPALTLALLMTPLIFPDGRLPSGRWTPVAAVVLVAFATLSLGTILRPGPLESAVPADNPTGVDGLAGAAQMVIDVSSLVLVACLPLSVAAAVTRFRRGTTVERQQLKWFGSATGLAAAALIGAVLLPEPFGTTSWKLMTVSLGLVPVAIGIAILRYRLYEIDRLVSRTLSYALVTALLATVFVGTNLVLQSAVVSVTGATTLTTAVSTLVVASLFQPVRRRVQVPIDRRFNRTRVDGERVVQAFAGQLRDQVDLDRLRGAVVAAADDAVAPTGASLWLRGAR
ncbi:MAG TPA: hypothetical protein VFW02_00275 [Candidatus Limnocylindrales bacterium]|nr:hypothetical protein [Candidatus Limnocylindrales bacterium]